MSSQKEFKRPQKSRFRSNLEKNKQQQQEIAQALNKEHDGPAVVQRRIAPKTEYEQWRIWDTWVIYAEEIQKRDPYQLWIDLLDSKPVAQVFKAFWDQYVVNSVTERPTLRPNEYEEVRGVNSVISVLGYWKTLLAAADTNVMQKKRLACPDKSYHYTTLISTNGLHGRGPIYAITQWIEGELADKHNLTRRQTFTKIEMTSDDIIVLLKAFWTRGLDISCTPSLRLAFHSVILMSGIGGFRPGVLMGLKYSNVRLGLVRDPGDRVKRRLVVHIKIEQNKQKTKHVRHDQADTLTFSVTLVPCPLVCLASLLVARALYDDAFLPEYKFKSLQDILERPKLGEVDYISLDWKEEFHQKSIVPIAYFKFKELWDQTLLVAGFRQQERPYSMRVGAGGRLNGALEPAIRSYVLSNSETVFRNSYQPQHVREELQRIAFGDTLAGRNQELFNLLQRSSLRRDENAPIYPTPAQLQTLEDRQDLKRLRMEYNSAVATGKGKPYNAEANRLSANIQWIRESLSHLFIQKRRAEYFAMADRLRAIGEEVPQYGREPSPFRAYEPESGEASERLGEYLASHLNSPPSTHSDRWSVVFVDMLLALQRRLHAQVDRLSAEALAELTDIPLAPIPTSTARQATSPHKCLICLATYVKRGSLTKHNTIVHCRASGGILMKPLRCPECERKRIKQPPIINGPIEWSNHVERCHGKENAPSPPSGLIKLMTSFSVPKSKLLLAKHQEQCLICEDVFEAGSGFNRHVTMAHEKTGFFDTPFDCPACKRTGSAIPIDDVIIWRVHVMKVHSEGARFSHLLTPKRKLDEALDRDQNERVVRKRQAIELPANGLVPGSPLQPTTELPPKTLWSSRHECPSNFISSAPA